MPDEYWAMAEIYLYEIIEAYESIGPVGLFGLGIANAARLRFDSGERSNELYDEIMAFE